MQRKYANDEDHLSDRAKTWIEKLPYRKRWEGPVDLEKSALLVIDMQRYFIDRDAAAYLPVGEIITENINELADLFSQNGAKVIYTRHVDDKDNGVMEEWWGALLSEGREAELTDKIDKGGPVVVKSTYSPYYGTGLLDELDGIENVFISGVMTDICCSTAARDSFVRGFRTFFLADGTATSSEEAHTAALWALSHGIAEVIQCRDVTSRFL